MVEKKKSSRKEIGAARREQTREKLLAAAARMLAELGESKSSISDFVEAAGVARGTFYNYYSTREELLKDLWMYIGHSPFLGIRDAAASYSDPAERLSVGCRLALLRAAADPTWGWLIYALSRDHETVIDDFYTFPGPALLAGRETGRFQFDSFEGASDVILGAIRTAWRGLLLGIRQPNYIEAVIVQILKSVGIDAKEAKDIAARPLPGQSDEAQSA